MADSKKVEGEEPGKKGGKLKWIILLVLIIVLGAGGFFAYQHFFMNKTKTQVPVAQGETSEGTPADEGTSAEGKLGPTQMFTLPAFVVNLADPLGRRYLKLSLEIELKNQAAVDATTKAMPKIKDGLLLLLSSKTFADLSSMENKIVLKNEIMSRLGQILGSGNVLNVYFTDFIVQ